MDMKTGILIGAVIALFVLYVFSYFGSRRYLIDPFANQAAAAVAGSAEPKPVEFPKPTERWGAEGEVTLGVSGEDVATFGGPVAPPFTDSPIDNLDDYEYNMIFKSESDRPLTDPMRSKLMSQYPLDWSGYPPSSTEFQAGLQQSFQNATMEVPDDAKPYQAISGNSMQPPDTGALEMEERKILMTYKPEFPPDPTAYDPADVEDLVKKIYAKRGLVPQIKKREGSNVYDIVGTTKIGEKVVFEDEVASAPASGEAVVEAGEGVTQGPLAASAIRGGNGNVAGMSVAPDRFFEEGGNMGGNKWDYTAWTPGLERSFAPSAPREKWY